jgi:hypothetical protein
MTAIRSALGQVLGKIGKTTMSRIQLHGPMTVDAMPPTPRTDVDRLRELLAGGVEAAPDEHRPNFFTVSHSGYRYYFYISPVSAKVWLLEALSANGAAAGAHAMASRA